MAKKIIENESKAKTTKTKTTTKPRVTTKEKIISSKVGKAPIELQEETKTVEYTKVYAIKLISLFSRNPEIVCYSLSQEKLVEINNKYLLESCEVSKTFPYEYYYKEGSPLRYFDAIRKEYIEKEMAGIFETWLTDEQLRVIKKVYWFV